MNTALFIAMCVLALLNIILYTFVSSAIHKRDLCQASPYYHCDTSWQCCMATNDPNTPPCDASNTGPVNGTNAYSIAKHFYGENTNASVGSTGHNGVGFLTCASPINSSKPYYEACVQPIQVIMKNYDGSKGAPNFDCVYSATPATCTTSGGMDLQATYLTSAYGVQNFVKGQCCYQKIDPDTNSSGSVPSPPTPAGTGNLYPVSGNLYKWSSSTAFPGNYATTPATQNFNYPIGSNTSTQNNTCNNSLFANIPGAPAGYTPASYSGCPTNTP
jgi:hypothetical protein